MEKEGIKNKPETHYGSFIIILVAVVACIGGVAIFTYVTEQHDLVIQNEKSLISNMSCDQLWVEETKRFDDYSWFSAAFFTVRNQYHEDCTSKIFGNSEPSQDQQDAYFLSLDCKTLQSYVKNQNLYFERAIIDYKEMCKQ